MHLSGLVAFQGGVLGSQHADWWEETLRGSFKPAFRKPSAEHHRSWYMNAHWPRPPCSRVNLKFILQTKNGPWWVGQETGKTPSKQWSVQADTMSRSYLENYNSGRYSFSQEINQDCEPGLTDLSRMPTLFGAKDPHFLGASQCEPKPSEEVIGVPEDTGALTSSRCSEYFYNFKYFQ